MKAFDAFSMPVKETKDTLFGVLAALLYILCLRPLSLVEANAPFPSPEASTELICHTQHASECYPAIFQPTEHFQLIHHDQSLPAGLHIRMNLATGLKEARLNIPEPSDVPPADLIIIDNPSAPTFVKSAEEPVEDASIEAMQEQSNTGRDYPYIPSHFDAGESTLFLSSVSILRSFSVSAASEAILSSLETLTELCHDYHWGLTLTKDAELVTQLIDIFHARVPDEIRSYAALLLGTAIQNNPDALAALLENTNGDEPSSTVMQAILGILKEPVRGKGDPTLHRRIIFLLSQLVNDPLQLHTFLMKDGIDILHGLFNVKILAVPTSHDLTFLKDSRDKLHAKIANFMYDHVLSTLDGDEGLQLAAQLVHRNGNGKREHDLQDLTKVLEPWNLAFNTALDDYAVFFIRKEGAEAPVSHAAYQSVQEAMGALKKVLKIP